MNFHFCSSSNLQLHHFTLNPGYASVNDDGSLRFICILNEDKTLYLTWRVVNLSYVYNITTQYLEVAVQGLHQTRAGKRLAVVGGKQSVIYFPSDWKIADQQKSLLDECTGHLNLVFTMSCDTTLGSR